MIAEARMPDPRQVDIYHLLFEQTPLVLRYVLGVLSLGLFTLATTLYRWHRADLQKVNARMDVMERRHQERIARLESVVEAHNAETNRLLMQIATNTRQARDMQTPNSEDQI